MEVEAGEEVHEIFTQEGKPVRARGLRDQEPTARTGLLGISTQRIRAEAVGEGPCC